MEPLSRLASIARRPLILPLLMAALALGWVALLIYTLKATA
jgi:hypothetical protein